jgi:hypothetical protein
MAKAILIDELHVTVRAPHGLPEKEYAAMHRTLRRRPFATQLRQAVRGIVRKYPDLSKARVNVSR